jgi:hypothetical protein
MIMRGVERNFGYLGNTQIAGTRVIAYSSIEGRYVVVEYLPEGEDMLLQSEPSVHRFQTIEEAIVCWQRIQNRWLGEDWQVVE